MMMMMMMERRPPLRMKLLILTLLRSTWLLGDPAADTDYNLDCVNNYLFTLNCSLNASPAASDQTYWLKVVADLDQTEYKCLLKNTTAGFFCSLDRSLTPYNETGTFSDDEEFEISLCENHNKTCELLKEDYEPELHIKPSAPCCLEVSHNSTRLRFTWKSTYERFSRMGLRESLTYQLQIHKMADKHRVRSSSSGPEINRPAELGAHAGKRGRRAETRGGAAGRQPGGVHAGPGLPVRPVPGAVPAALHGEPGLQQHVVISGRPEHAGVGLRLRGPAAGPAPVGAQPERLLPVLQPGAGLRLLALQRHLPGEGVVLVLQRVLHPQLPAAGRLRRGGLPWRPEGPPALLRGWDGGINPAVCQLHKQNPEKYSLQLHGILWCIHS
ncbi:uncharacterized protein LOC103481062 isoform X2 [Poecilia reticulata]|uniref:uncharacterized protein LOC103481062 isoform X2 n=1 Tax=Poecilia reticulata TaxID=8081 RepID=UPI0007EC24C5|nr:PREDICTED: uncharacterized protein LOC103481062 isoform X2 [Poecilia reticulata]